MVEASILQQFYGKMFCKNDYLVEIKQYVSVMVIGFLKTCGSFEVICFGQGGDFKVDS